MPVNAREAACRALASHRKSGSWSDSALNTILLKEKLDERDAALASRIFYGVIQNLSICDFYVSAFSSVKISKMEPQILDILRLSVYQLVYLSKIPANAAVNEGVELAKKHANPRAAGLVNAILRKISSQIGHLPEVTGSDIYEKLSILYSHPVWLVKAFCQRLGIDGAEALLKMNNEDPGITVTINTLKTTAAAAIESLSSANVDARIHPWLSGSLDIENVHNIQRLEAFAKGWIYVQDPAAVLAVTAAEPKPGQFVIDGCAAPGGKSFVSALLMNDTGRVLSADINEKKLHRIVDGASRLGLKSIETCVMDARITDASLLEQADIVLADVPCSGFGVIRKKPEIRFKTEAEVNNLPAIQLEIIENLSKYVKPGGILLYSTCTLLHCENEGIIGLFLSKHPEFSAEPFVLPAPVGTVADGMITLWPHLHGTDGFFICRLRRRQ